MVQMWMLITSCHVDWDLPLDAWHHYHAHHCILVQCMTVCLASVSCCRLVPTLTITAGVWYAKQTFHGRLHLVCWRQFSGMDAINHLFSCLLTTGQIWVLYARNLVLRKAPEEKWTKRLWNSSGRQDVVHEPYQVYVVLLCGERLENRDCPVLIASLFHLVFCTTFFMRTDASFYHACLQHLSKILLYANVILAHCMEKQAFMEDGLSS